MNRRRRQNKNIVLIGMPGVGKTTIGKLLSQHIRRNFIDVDHYLEEKYQMTIPQMFAISEEYFRSKEREVIVELSRKKQLIISTGGGVVKMQDNMQNLKENGVIIFLQRNIADIFKTMQGDNRPLLAENPLEQLTKLYEERLPLYKSYADYEVFIQEDNIRQSIDDIMQILKARGLINKR